MAVVLIIEDNIDIRENASEMLELAGHEVVVATDGKDGIGKASKTDVDIILCDIMMPEADGFEVFHKLRENASTASIPFVFLTASAEPSQIKKGLEMGANAYIPKPFTEEELLAVVERFCEK